MQFVTAELRSVAEAARAGDEGAVTDIAQWVGRQGLGVAACEAIEEMQGLLLEWWGAAMRTGLSVQGDLLERTIGVLPSDILPRELAVDDGADGDRA